MKKKKNFSDSFLNLILDVAEIRFGRKEDSGRECLNVQRESKIRAQMGHSGYVSFFSPFGLCSSPLSSYLY